MAALEEDPFQQYDLDDAIGFSLDWHPTRRLLAVALVTGQLKLLNCDGEEPTQAASSKPHEGACRNVRFAPDGESVLSVGSDGSLQRRDVATNKRVWKHAQAHGAAANALACTGASGVATGDDDGAVKLWDLRQRTEALSFTESSDLVTDLAFVDGKAPTLVASSADGCLCTFDLRRGALGAMSDNQEDELLSLAPMKNGTKLVVGTESGVLGIFSWGDWGDVSDRLLGHPQSVDAVVPINDDVLLSASSDGILRVVGVHPNRVLGVVGEHRDHPVEAIALTADGERLASCAHDETVRLWDVGYLKELKHTARGFKRRQEEAGSSGAQADADGDGGDDDDDDDDSDDDDDEGEEAAAPRGKRRVKAKAAAAPPPPKQPKQIRKKGTALALPTDFFTGL